VGVFQQRRYRGIQVRMTGAQARIDAQAPNGGTVAYTVGCGAPPAPVVARVGVPVEQSARRRALGEGPPEPTPRASAPQEPDRPTEAPSPGGGGNGGGTPCQGGGGSDEDEGGQNDHNCGGGNNTDDRDGNNPGKKK
jgi:hypothetical protein